MVRITKVYTKTGDQGQTQLADNQKISKTACHIEAIGCIDELNSFIGFAVVMIAHHTSFAGITTHLRRIQNELFDLGAELSLSINTPENMVQYITAAYVTQLETEIDEYNASLPHLNSFIIPGNEEMSARLHLARAVCRRTERALFAMHETVSISPTILAYINRLSDWLFVLSRYIVHQLEIPETFWQPKRNQE